MRKYVFYREDDKLSLYEITEDQAWPCVHGHLFCSSEEGGRCSNEDYANSEQALKDLDEYLWEDDGLIITADINRRYEK